jgi:hypothetical protein
MVRTIPDKFRLYSYDDFLTSVPWMCGGRGHVRDRADGRVRPSAEHGGLRNVASRLTAGGGTWSDLGPVGMGSPRLPARGRRFICRSEIGRPCGPRPGCPCLGCLATRPDGLRITARGEIEEDPDDADAIAYILYQRLEHVRRDQLGLHRHRNDGVT